MSDRAAWWRFPTALAMVALLAFLPAFVKSPYHLHVLVLILLYVVLGLGLNVVVGFAGLLDLGYVAFYAVGAYSYAILNTRYHLPFWEALLLGGVLAALMGVLLGLPTLRVRGDYLALVTLGLGEIVRLTLVNWEAVTNGARGVMGIQGPGIPGQPFPAEVHYYYTILGIATLTTVLVWRLRHSTVGLLLAAIRDEETAARCVGIEPVRWKLFAFAVGAFLAGVAGVFFAGWQHFVSPDSFTLLESVLILCIVVMGGMGSIRGTMAAAAFLVVLPEGLRQFAQYRMLIFGIALVAVVVLQETQRRRRAERLAQRGRAAGAIPDHGEAAPPVVPPGGWLEPGLVRSEALLDVQGLSHRFGGIQAVCEVSLQVRPRELVALIGPNGAGKTTLFHCMSGVIRPDQGSVRVPGTDGELTRVAPLPERVARAGVARTFQDIRLFETLTIRQHLVLAARCGKSSRDRRSPRQTRKREEAFVDWLLRYLRLGDGTRRVSSLPLAEQRRVGVARALATRARVLLLDEPAAGLNDHEKEEFCDLLRRIRDELDVSILLIEHDMRNVVMRRVGGTHALVDRILVMHQGRLITEGTPEEIQLNAEVRRVYLGSAEYAASH